jgi:hypothetical protein
LKLCEFGDPFENEKSRQAAQALSGLSGASRRYAAEATGAAHVAIVFEADF